MQECEDAKARSCEGEGPKVRRCDAKMRRRSCESEDAILLSLLRPRIFVLSP